MSPENTKAMFREIPVFSAFEELIAAESTRHGGVSQAPYQQLNLGLYTKDDPQAVRENRKLFFTALHVPLTQIAGAHQVHGTEIKIVDQAGEYPGYDGFICAKENIFLSITVADCMPALIYDPRQKVIGAVHAGWRGTVGDITGKCLDMMIANFGTQAKDCIAWMGTCIDECSFEVDEDVAQHFESSFKRWDAKKAKYFIDLKQANKIQLTSRDVPENQIACSEYSTFLNNEDYFSYRKEKGQCGRMLAIIGRKGK